MRMEVSNKILRWEYFIWKSDLLSTSELSYHVITCYDDIDFSCRSFWVVPTGAGRLEYLLPAHRAAFVYERWPCSEGLCLLRHFRYFSPWMSLRKISLMGPSCLHIESSFGFLWESMESMGSSQHPSGCGLAAFQVGHGDSPRRKRGSEQQKWWSNGIRMGQ